MEDFGFAAHMEQENSLLEAFAVMGEVLRTAIASHSWEEMERQITRMRDLSARIHEVEQKRNQSYNEFRASLGGSPRDGFYQTITRLDPVTREKYSEIYRRLKFSILGIRGLSQNLDAYIRTYSIMLKGVFQEIFPPKTSAVYSARGTFRDDGDLPRFLNTHG